MPPPAPTRWVLCRPYADRRGPYTDPPNDEGAAPHEATPSEYAWLPDLGSNQGPTDLTDASREDQRTSAVALLGLPRRAEAAPALLGVAPLGIDDDRARGRVHGTAAQGSGGEKDDECFHDRFSSRGFRLRQYAESKGMFGLGWSHRA